MDFIINAIIFLSWIFLVVGIIGLFRLKGVYTRLLSSSKIDSVTIITLFFGLMLKTGFSMMTVKLSLILLFYLLTNPVTNQILAHSAYTNGVEPLRRKD